MVAVLVMFAIRVVKKKQANSGSLRQTFTFVGYVFLFFYTRCHGMMLIKSLLKTSDISLNVGVVTYILQSHNPSTIGIT